MPKVKTGGTVEVSGLYKPTGTKHTIVLSKGDRVPPYDLEATTFTLVQKTK